MGINQLVDMYKGNPQPLQARVQQAQKNQPPGAIPPDLEEAIALQKITELRNSAQNQQAMQGGGAQPSIVEKLRQMAGAEQRQQGQPPQMPQGGPQMSPQGVDALPTNVANNTQKAASLAALAILTMEILLLILWVELFPLQKVHPMT
jgi:hypothetical protein